MNTNDMAKALAKIGEGFHDLSIAVAADVDDANEPDGLNISADNVEGQRRRQAIVLHAIEKAGGRIHRDDMADVARSVGYDNRGMAGFYTKQADLVRVERDDRGTDTGYRILTDKGRRRLDYNRKLLPPESDDE